MALQKRTYLPRSTIDYTAIRTVYEYAEDEGLTFGKALEKILLDSKKFNIYLEKLSKGCEWLSEDVEKFITSVNKIYTKGK